MLLYEFLDGNPSTYQLTSSEREVLGFIVQSDSPQLADKLIIGNENYVAAKDKLIRLGFLDNDGNLTNDGQQLVDNQGITGDDQSLDTTLPSDDQFTDVDFR